MAQSLTFFATAAEQAQWLKDVLGDSTWSVAKVTGRSGYMSLGPEQWQANDFRGRDSSLRIYAGLKEASGGPVWRKGHNGAELDFVLSQAVQILPSMLDDGVLYEGTVATMRPEDYRAAGMSFGPVRRLYGTLTGALETFAVDRAKVLVALPGESPKPARGKFLVTDGAYRLHRAGTRLKQFADSLIEYSLGTNQKV